MYTKKRLYHPMYSHLLSKYHNKDYSKCEPVQYGHACKTIPPANIFETDDKFDLSLAAPGMSKSDFNIKIDKDILMISADIKEDENKDVKHRYSKKEYSYKSLERKFRLPKDIIDSNNISAKYENGELFITIPKKEEAKDLPPRDIQIK